MKSGNGYIQGYNCQAAVDANVIAHNVADGIATPNLITELTILGNSIYANGELGIDLSNDGPTPNDPGDGDSGPNDVLNTPILTAVAAAGANIDITYDVDLPAGTYRVEFFRNPSGTDAPQTGEGEQFAGFEVGAGGGEGQKGLFVDGLVSDRVEDGRPVRFVDCPSEVDRVGQVRGGDVRVLARHVGEQPSDRD